MKLSIGNPVEGDDFFDREVEQKQLWRKLDRDHILLLAPRRIGKTSLLLRLQATAEENGFHAVVCSFAPCNDELDCVKKLVAAVTGSPGLPARLKDGLLEGLKKIKGIKIAGQGIELAPGEQISWREVGEEFTRVLEKQEGNWVVCVDEVPVFVLKLLKQERGTERTRGFLYWFRDLRQRHHQRVRWVLAGSIGLDTVVHRLGLGDTINDLSPSPLGAFDEPTAHKFLDELSSSYDLHLEPAVRSHIIKRIGWPVPYYLQIMVDKLLEKSGSDSSPDVSVVDLAFEELLSPAYKIHFDYWCQRLHEELGAPDDDHAIQLLNAICQDPSGATNETLSQALSGAIEDAGQRAKTLRYLVDVLVMDGYLVQVEDRLRFRLEWLRLYWQRRVAA